MSKVRGLGLRMLTAAVALPLVLALIWVPEWHLGFALFIAALACVGLYEYYALVRCRAISPETIGGMLAGTIVAFSGYYHLPTITSLFLYGSCLMVSTLHIVRGQHSVAGLASSLFGVFYVGWFSAHITLLHSVPKIGPGLVTILLVVIASTDAFAYLGGMTFGRHKLAPMVSPNKTWEGSVIGFCFAIIAMLIIYSLRYHWDLSGLPTWSFRRYMATGAILSVVGQIGDLAESCLKRSAGIKDSGVLFPGHGGALDRCDAILFATPVLYYMVTPLG